MSYSVIIGGDYGMKTISEVSDIVNMTCRTIRLYEEEGVVSKPKTKNKYGYFLYSDDDVKKLWQIRFYKEVGYNHKQIKAIFTNPNYNEQEELKKAVELLERKKEELEQLIQEAKAMTELPFTPLVLKFAIPTLEDATYNDVTSVFSAIANYSPTEEEMDASYVDVLTKEEEERYFNTYEKIFEIKNRGFPYDDSYVQEYVRQLYLIESKQYSGSVLMFSYGNMINYPDSEIAKEIDDEYGKGSSKFLFKAIYHFCTINSDNETDNLLNDSLVNLERLARKRCTTNSSEVQNEVANIFEYCTRMKYLNFEGQINMLYNMSQLFNSKEYKEVIDNGAEKGISWFISRAIEIFYNNIKKQKEV